MANLFNIDIPNNHLKLEKDLTGELVFNVTNTSGYNMRARAQLMPKDLVEKKWATVENPEREIADSMMERFKVKLHVPLGTPAGNYDLRLNMVGADRPDDYFVEGPLVKLEVGATKAPINRKPFIIAAVVAAVIVIGILLFIIFRPKPLPNAEFAFTMDESNPRRIAFAPTEIDENAIYVWDFDDGTTSAEPNPVHVFTQAGDYEVILTVEGANGTSTQTINVSIPAPPVANFTASTNAGVAPVTVDFEGVPEGDVTAYAWDFNGDGEIDSTDSSGSYTYNNPGSYTVVFTVRGSGGQNSMEQMVNVSMPAQPPMANFDMSSTGGTVPHQIQFTNMSTGDITSYAWDFDGDGSTDSWEQNPSYTYTTAGAYTVTLSVAGVAGENSNGKLVTLTNPEPPVAMFDVSANTGVAPHQVRFFNLSTGDVQSVSWDFNSDGLIDSTDLHPIFTYHTPGAYTASMMASGAGGTSNYTLPITVNAPEQPIDKFTGTWNNTDPNTRGITKVQITSDGYLVTVQMWGSCSPTDCDWGTTTTTVDDAVDGQLNLTWNVGWVIRTQTLSILSNGNLYVSDFSDYQDDREDRTSDYTFRYWLNFGRIDPNIDLSINPNLFSITPIPFGGGN